MSGRSREWKQVYAGDDHIAEACNLLDGDGWSIHSVIQTQYNSADHPASGDRLAEKAVTILAWRAVFVKPVPVPSSSYRE